MCDFRPDTSSRCLARTGACTGSENRCRFAKAHTPTSCAHAPFERRDCFMEWTAAHPRKSHSVRVLRSYQYAKKTAAFSLSIGRLDRRHFEPCDAPAGDSFRGQSWGQQGTRNSKPRVYLEFSMR